jgi:hypothetical protein
VFKIPLLHRKKIVSDEGFTITFVSRNVLQYDGSHVSLLFDIDGDGKRMDVLARSARVAHDANSVNLPDDMILRKIEDDISRALEWRGWLVRLIA